MKERLLKVIDKCSEYSLYSLILFIPISNAMIEISFIFCLLFFILKKILNPDFKFLKSYAHLFLLLFALFNILSFINSGPYLLKSIKTFFAKWVEYFLIFLIAEDTLRGSAKKIQNCLFIFLFIGGILGIDALTQRFLGLEFIRLRSVPQAAGNAGIAGVTASFHHHNDFGAYLLFILPLVIASILNTKKRYQLDLLLLLLLLLSALILTFSRGAWFGFIALLLLMISISHKFKELVSVLLIFIILILFLPIANERFLFSFQIGGDADRLVLWRSALKMINENPFFGKGLGTFMVYFREHANLVIQYAHNCYLQMWAEAGIFTLLSFLLFSGYMLFKGIKAFRRNNDFFALGLTCGIFGFLVHSFFDTQLYSLQLSVLFWAAMGILQALGESAA